MVPYNEERSKECESLLFNRKCALPAKIQLVAEHIRHNDQIARKQEQNRERHDKIVEEMLALNVDGFAQAIEELGGYIQNLLQEQAKSNKFVTSIGIKFFYHVVDNMNDITMKFQPTKSFYSQMLHDLGVSTKEINARWKSLKIFTFLLIDFHPSRAGRPGIAYTTFGTATG